MYPQSLSSGYKTLEVIFFVRRFAVFERAEARPLSPIGPLRSGRSVDQVDGEGTGGTAVQ